MAVSSNAFMSVTADRSTKSQQQVLAQIQGHGRPHVRRPTNGIVLKDDTFATMRVVANVDGSNQLLVDAGSRRNDVQNEPLVIDGKRATDLYSNFLIQQVQEDRQEKFQILETFGEPFLFLFGERARVINFQGVLVDTFDFNWKSEWWHNYENYLRGTKCVENDARIFLSYDRTLLGGYILSASATQNAQEKSWINFQFQMFITSYSDFSQLGDPNAYSGEQLSGRSTKSLLRPQEQDWSEEVLTQFRPKLLAQPEGLATDASLSVGNGQVRPDSLEKAITNNLRVVVSAWNSVQSIIETQVTGISGMLTGSHVRVPVGFAGTMAYGDDVKVSLADVHLGGVVKFTTFSDNDAEYVGTSDHYGSSRTDLSVIEGLGFTDRSSTIKYGQDLVKKASEVWADYGIEIPNTQMGLVATLLSSRVYGLAAVGAARAWAGLAGLVGDVTAGVASGNINSASTAVQPFATAASRYLAGILE